jgi:hypothetical protein
MKNKAVMSLSIAACLAFVYPQLAPAQGADQSQSAMMHSAAEREAMVMAPASANLVKTLQADKVRQGDEFKAKLDKPVHLKNGPDLPSGTVLVGRVTADQMKPGGPSTLALRFTQADLKDGKVVPIKATIVGITRPRYDTGYNIANESPMWSAHTVRVDEVGALSGVDLHSNIASRNSGVFVSQKKENMKFDSGSQLSLAIAARDQANQNAENRNNGGL